MRTVLLSVLCVLLLGSSAGAQRKIMNMEDHDYKNYYFGLTFGLNFAQYRIHNSSSFAETDTFHIVQPHARPGFNLGLMANLRLTKFVDLRFVPTLSFAEKQLVYNFQQRPDSILTKNIESIYMNLPLQLKFKSDRIKNFRFYAIAGGRLDYDLASNARSRKNDEFLKVKALDLGVDVGFGFEFYYPNFIFSPEIKFSQGLTNQIYFDRSLPLTNAIDDIKARSVVISIHLEG